MKKTLFLIILAISLTLGFTAIPAVSAEAIEGEQIMPCYIGTKRIEAILEISSNRSANCGGYAKLIAGYTGDMSMELQRSTDEKTWAHVTTWTTSGNGSIMLDKSWYVSQGFYYRVVVTVDVYNAYGKYIESPSATSLISQ